MSIFNIKQSFILYKHLAIFTRLCLFVNTRCVYSTQLRGSFCSRMLRQISHLFRSNRSERIHSDTVGIFLDLSKAFDTANHDNLFDKFEHYGIRGVALDWMKNYFHNRLQFVQYNDTLSTFNLFDVEYRKVLSLVHFFFYYISMIYAMLQMYLNLLILFADDTNLFYSHKNQSSLANVINDGN